MNEKRPSLRVEELAITNFRTFRDRTVIPFGDPGSGGDAIVTFHGDNGSGKSNAIAAMELFFEAAIACLTFGGAKAQLVGTWDRPVPAPGGGQLPLVVRYRDRPAGAVEPTVVQVTFAEIGTLAVGLTPLGEQVRISLSPSWEGRDDHEAEKRSELLTALSTPFGPGSRPLAVLDARRRAHWVGAPDRTRLLPAALADELFAHRTSLRPDQREKWRHFTRILADFASFQGKEISIERLPDDSVPQIVVEERGRSVLAFPELSSGEQQVLLLCAASLLAGAGILVIEEPEISLDVKNQRLLEGILRATVHAGHVDQIVLESHVPSFDGPSVVRFRRDEQGASAVERGPGATAADAELARKAESQGAKQRWVTGDGYTQLPERMREELHIGAGAHVWFLKGAARWEAFREEDLTDLLAPDEETERSDG
jgi:AAA domain, putative AbiEii toxin, Type IV TA system